jgi:hypothetical protein
VIKALVPQSSVNRRGANTFVSKERSVLTGKSFKMRKVVVRDGDEVAMWVAGGRLSVGMVMETDFVWAPEMLLGDDSGGSAFRHAGRVGSPNV